ncbi:hypothetical protein GLAREA_12538 [Glarea lozoyensis ATCC 20868]|uniref:Uncharacterized protein n=1 Tax=Glarea lozoyensis (strain ATCC 20868 / MF5171) TaxID=1116229 RepID=S3D065_GLAL2|nr:uncharacterized protein GLAREA_12538 [Glarea lozoyensis ATCC 20868]EPE31235.1 hypothetical protein GLAREA_12538 [Glarea lozoyensis ATCC 20868]
MGVFVTEDIMPKKELNFKASKVTTKSDDPPSELNNRWNGVEIFIRNLTQFEMFLCDSYTNWGRAAKGPASTVLPFSTMTYSYCNKTFSPGGVGAGNAFKLRLDSSQEFAIAIGFTNARLACRKAGIKNSSKAEDGYDAANDQRQSIVSGEYEGKCEETGDSVKFTIEAASEPGSITTITIEQRIKG